MPKFKIIVQDENGQIVSQSDADKFIIASSQIDAEGKVNSFCNVNGDLDRLARLYLLLGRHIHSQTYPNVIGKPKFPETPSHPQLEPQLTKPKPEPKNKVKVGD